ncbi:MAG: hypothetical protein Kow00121_56810 [Elainellaceae cyanobacterium]
MNVTKEAIDQVNSILQDLPEKPKEKLSLREAVDQLQDQIKDALAKGYSYEDVAVMLTNQGIKISPSTLKRYVPAGKGRAAKRKVAAPGTRTRRARKTKGEGATATESGNGASPDLSVVENLDAEAPQAEEDAKTPRRRGGKAAAKSKTEPTAKTDATTTKSTTGRRTRSSATATESAAKPRSTARSTTARSSSTRRRKK